MAVPGVGFRAVVRLDEAVSEFLSKAQLKPPGVEVLDVLNAHGRVLAEDVVSPLDLPGEDKAAMDGYAVRAEDTFGASPDNPAKLKLVGRVLAGSRCSVEVGEREAVEVSTGAPIPRGANAVVRYEDAMCEGGYVYVLSPVTPYENVNRRGSDVKVGSVVAREGSLLRAPDVALLHALGVRKVKVYSKPKVGVVSVGSELVEEPGPPPPGKVVDVDRVMVKLLLRSCLCEPVDLEICRDDPEELSQLLLSRLGAVDAVVTIGGLSVGRVDVTVDALRRAGADVVVHGVSIRPGKPVALSLLRGKPVISLPGPPVAAYVAFRSVAVPVLLSLAGLRRWYRACVRARLARNVPSKLGVRDFVRVVLSSRPEGLVAEPVKVGGSGLLSTLTRADGVVEVPEDREGLLEGEEVDVGLVEVMWSV